MILDPEHWHAKPGGGRNLFKGMDGIRGIAILLVVSSHAIPFLYMDTPLKRWLCVISANGTLGVWLFFVLSGFLISLPFFKRLEEGRDWYPEGYFFRRAAKVIPPLYISILSLALFMMWEDHSWLPIKGALETMAFFQIFKMPNPVITPIYWSLAAEVTFYAALPILFLILRNPLRTKPWLIPLIFLMVASFTWVGVADRPDVVQSYPFIRDVLLSLVFFAWGTTFSCFYLTAAKEPTKLSGLCVAAGLVLLVVCCCVWTQYWLAHKKYVDGLFSRLVFMNGVGASAFLMLFVAYDARPWVCRFLAYPLLSLAGLISYEWYLFHLLFIGFSNLITGPELHGSYGKLMIRIFFAFPVSFIFSALFYRFFSLPILRWAHRSNT